MLKVYKNTILICFAIEIITFAVSILCENAAFEHSGIIQDYSIGIACSLLVVSITTLVQYNHEHNQVCRKYVIALKRMLRAMNRAMNRLKYEKELSRTDIILLDDGILEASQEVDELSMQLCWFHISKNKLHKEVEKGMLNVFKVYFMGRIESREKAIESVFHSKRLTELYEAIWRFMDLERDRVDVIRMRDEYWGMLDYEEEEDENEAAKKQQRI